MRNSWIAAPLLAFAVATAFAAPGAAEDFYKGKTLTIIVGTTAGGGYDADARLLGKHIGRHIPGSPTVAISNVPGASGVLAANNLYAQAPRDGTTIGTFNSAMPFLEAIGAPGVRYKSADYSWIGNLSQSVQVVVVWHSSGITSLEDAKQKEVLMGSLGPGGTMSVFPRLLNAEFNTKFKIVGGYPGGNEVNLAMERGEVQGRGAGAWTTWKHTNPDWVRDGAIVPILQIGPKKAPDLPDVPLLADLAKTEEQRQILDIVVSPSLMGRPLLMPPGVPAERLAAFRQAFKQSMEDPQFVAEAKKANLEISMVSGEQIQQMLARLYALPKDIVQKAARSVEK